MLQSLTNEQIKILEDYRRSGLGLTEYVRNYNMKVHQLSYILGKEKRLKEVSQTNEIVKLDTSTITNNKDVDINNASPISIHIGEMNIDITNNFDERLLTKVIKVCIDASGF